MYNHPNNYLHAIAARAHAAAAKWSGVLKEASDGPARLGAPDTFMHFRGISQAELQAGRFTRPITVTDIETGNNDQVISVAAIKGVLDKKTGEFRVLDTLEKYYVPDSPSSQSFNMAREVHKLTPQKIDKLRQLQKATYGEKYDQQEAAELLKFMHGSLVVGHNVEEFDFPRLGLAQDLQSEDILDTLVWAENAGVPRGKRGLSKLFKHYTGRSLTKAGYSHHFGFHDVLSNAELLSALYNQKGRAGRDLRYVATHKGFSYGAYEGVAGTAIIKGGYYRGRGPRGLENYMYEDEFDEKGVFEYDYDENGRRILPEGYSETGEWDDPEELGITQSNIFRLEAGNTFRALREEMARVRETMLGYSVSQKHALVRYLASKDEGVGEMYLTKLGYSKETIAEMMRQTMPLRIDRERKEANRKRAQALVQREKVRSYLEHMYRKGDITEANYNWLSDVNEEGSGFSPQDIIYRARESRDELAARRNRVQEHKAAEGLATFGELNSFVRDLNESPEVFDRKMAEKQLKINQDVTFDNLRAFVRDLNEEDAPFFDRNEAFKKSKYLDKIQRKKLITEEQRASLELIGSYDDLVDATDRVIEANERLLKMYGAIGNIKPYDINQYISSAKHQWGGTMGAAKGVIPNFIRNPISRLGDAAFNALDKSVSPWNAFNRTWNSGIGAALTAVGGVVGGVPGMMVGSAISGGVSALSQVVGNTAQAKMEMRMLGVQNNLNTLGAMISWISTPFQMLHKAIKLVTGAFGGLSLKLNNIMGGGINMMMQMGNPLEELTGVNYLNYQQAGLVDMASLLKGGSTNAAIEKLAMTQRDLYRYGKVDTDKMIAANMLGVFGEAFTPTTDVAGSYYGMANKILNDLRRVAPGSDAERNIMYYANKFDPTLAQTLRSANLLGVTDIRQMTDPGLTGNYMYWRPISKGRYGEEAQFRRTQYEYGIATQQFGYTKMRFADRLWNVVGRDLYNGVNRVIDALAGGDWRAALSSVEELWKSLKKTGSEIWAGINKDNKFGDKLSSGLNEGLRLIKEWGWKAAVGIIDIWNQIFGKILERAQGLIAYLSTVKVNISLEDGHLGFSLSTIKDYKPQDQSKIFRYHREQGEYVLDGTKEGMSEVSKLARILFPNASSEQLAKMTVGDLKREWVRRGTYGNWMPTDTSQFGLGNLRYTQEDADKLLDYLGMRGSSEPLGEAAAAFATDWNDYTSFDRKAAYDTVGIMPMYEKMIGSLMNDILPTIGKQIMSKSNEVNIDIVNKEGRTSVDVNGRPVIDASGNPILSQMVLDGTKISTSKRY